MEKRQKEERIKKEERVEMSSTPPRKITYNPVGTPKGKGIGQANYMFNKSGPPNVRRKRQENISAFPENHPLMRTEMLMYDPPTPEEQVPHNYKPYNFNYSSLSEENQMLARMGAAAAEYTIAENKKKNPHLYNNSNNDSDKFRTPPRKTTSKRQRKNRKTRKSRK